LKEASAVQRQILDLLPVDYAIDGVALIFDLWRYRFYRHDVLLGADLEV
jgi:hypothetical protein